MIARARLTVVAEDLTRRRREHAARLAQWKRQNAERARRAAMAGRAAVDGWGGSMHSRVHGWVHGWVHGRVHGRVHDPRSAAALRVTDAEPCQVLGWPGARPDGGMQRTRASHSVPTRLTRSGLAELDLYLP